VLEPMWQKSTTSPLTPRGSVVGQLSPNPEDTSSFCRRSGLGEKAPDSWKHTLAAPGLCDTKIEVLGEQSEGTDTTPPGPRPRSQPTQKEGCSTRLGRQDPLHTVERNQSPLVAVGGFSSGDEGVPICYHRCWRRAKRSLLRLLTGLVALNLGGVRFKCPGDSS
jgi:hypothetical protein